MHFAEKAAVIEVTVEEEEDGGFMRLATREGTAAFGNVVCVFKVAEAKAKGSRHVFKDTQGPGRVEEAGLIRGMRMKRGGSSKRSSGGSVGSIIGSGSRRIGGGRRVVVDVGKCCGGGIISMVKVSRGRRIIDGVMSRSGIGGRQRGGKRLMRCWEDVDREVGDKVRKFNGTIVGRDKNGV